MKELTERQAEILAFITKGILRGRPPSLREIGAWFELSLSGVIAHVRALEKKGKLIREKGRKRAVALPSGAEPAPPPPQTPPSTVPLPWGGTIG